MSWTTDNGEHELYISPTFADGAVGGSSSGQGIRVARLASGEDAPR